LLEQHILLLSGLVALLQVLARKEALVQHLPDLDYQHLAAAAAAVGLVLLALVAVLAAAAAEIPLAA